MSIARIYETWHSDSGEGYFACMQGVHLAYSEGWNDGFGVDDNSRGPWSVWEVVGSCNGSCRREVEIKPLVSKLVSKFLETGEAQELVLLPKPPTHFGNLLMIAISQPCR